MAEPIIEIAGNNMSVLVTRTPISAEGEVLTRVLLPDGREIELFARQAQKFAQALQEMSGSSQGHEPTDAPQAPTLENRWTRPLRPAGLVFFWFLVVILTGIAIATATALTAASELGGIGVFLTSVGLIVAALSRLARDETPWWMGMVISLGGLIVGAIGTVSP